MQFNSGSFLLLLFFFNSVIPFVNDAVQWEWFIWTVCVLSGHSELSVCSCFSCITDTLLVGAVEGAVFLLLFLYFVNKKSFLQQSCALNVNTTTAGIHSRAHSNCGSRKSRRGKASGLFCLKRNWKCSVVGERSEKWKSDHTGMKDRSHGGASRSERKVGCCCISADLLLLDHVKYKYKIRCLQIV